MIKLALKAKEFKKMVDPTNPKSNHVKYVCYVQASTITQEFDDWMGTNPREQKMTTNVATKIKNSLSDNENFHELNRGIVVSAKKATYNNTNGELVIIFDDPEIHGNIDGGHTLRAILEAKNSNILRANRYVFMEIFEGIENTVELAAARNTSVQVDLKSIAELENSFEVLKETFCDLEFSNRIQYKMNEHHKATDVVPIDIREIIAILLMFSQEIYPLKNAYGTLSEVQPIQCYSGKEASLRKFLTCNEKEDSEKQKINREQMIRDMSDIIPQIFKLWERIENNIAVVSTQAGKRYGARKYSKYNEGTVVGQSFFEQSELTHIVPKGIMYPLVGAFRALVEIDKDTRKYIWKKDPIDVWEKIGAKLVTMLLDEKTENPDVLAKNSNLWSNLFKEVYIFAYL